MLRRLKLPLSILIMALVALAAGVYITFFQSAGFAKTTATIVSIEELPRDFADEDTQYAVTVEYLAGGTHYTSELDYYSASFKVGKTTTVYYDPQDPTVVHGGRGFGVYLMILGVVLLPVSVYAWARRGV